MKVHCGECGKIFSDSDDFFNHCKETGHHSADKPYTPFRIEPSPSIYKLTGDGARCRQYYLQLLESLKKGGYLK